MVHESLNKLVFNNDVINKKKLQYLMSLTFHNYGVIRSSLIADKVKNLTFHYATRSGISLSVEDLRVPFRKRSLIGLTTNEVEITEQNFNSGNITAVERFQKVIDIWNNANNTLKDEVLTYFRESDPLNSLYIMAFSGARGNISQVRQLVGMRGLMADPQGQIIDLPIKSNFREGLKVTEYIISSYGARKGLVDTALRTADSGYLTRRLVDVAQDIIVREDDCLTQEGLSIDDLFNKYKTELSLEDRLVGRLLAKPLNFADLGLTFPADTEIDNAFINKVSNLKYDNITVRSPLTCNALRSVCRKCYGWHLSYSKLIDLGEAVGILAAQSIGEPGTQLTMRTFHTGGVFSGDLTKQIRAPFPGTLKYNLQSNSSMVRTMHGEKGFNLMEDVQLTIEDIKGNICTLDIPQGAMLLANNNQKVYCNQVVAEIQKNTNLILEEDRRDIYTGVSGEVFLQNVNLEESVDGEGATKKISKTGGLIWVLHGTRYVLKGNSKLDVCIGQKFSSKDTAASQLLKNKYSGIVNFDDNGDIQITNSSLIIENSKIKKINEDFDVLELTTPKRKTQFKLTAKENDFISHGQTIASLIEDSYKTKTGGIVFYSVNNFLNKKKRNTKKLFTGSLYLVPEETHQLNPSIISTLRIKPGCFIPEGTEIYSGVQTTISGYSHIDYETSELIIKPGELYQFNNADSDSEKSSRFVKPGDLIFSNFLVQKRSYLDFLRVSGKDYILLRPIETYEIPQEKGFNIEYKLFPNTKRRSGALQTVKRFFYKDGERIKSSNGGVNLLQTFFVLDIKIPYSSLSPKLEYSPLGISNGNQQEYKLKLTLIERVKITENFLKDLKLKPNLFIKYLVKNYQYVEANTAIAKLEMLANFGGTLVSVAKTNNLELLILNNDDIKKSTYNPDSEELFVKKGDLVRIGTYLATNTRAKYAGQVYKITKNEILIRLGLPYLISGGTILRVGNKSLVEKSDILATLVYDKLKTVDIVQGLPKVEEILEARKIKNGCLLAPTEGYAYFKNSKIEIKKSPGEKLLIDLSIDVDQNIKVNFNNGKYVDFLEPLTDGPISPHDKLDTLFNYYQVKYPIHEACKKSFKHLQLFLVNEVQRTYLSQGVQIADKHIEIIVKQMTSKVRVIYGGDTTLLPGEILEINQAEIITKAALSVNEEPPFYKPLLLGLTKASLNSDSFISAASFQETTRVLTEAAIEGKKDWLNGLKENVIIGRLIPAGTGFNCFENLKKVGKGSSSNLLINSTGNEKLKSFVLKARTE